MHAWFVVPSNLFTVFEITFRANLSTNVLRGQNSKTHIFLLSCSPIYSSRLFGCQVLEISISCRDVRLLLNLMDLGDAQLVVLKVTTNTKLRKNIVPP